MTRRAFVVAASCGVFLIAACSEARSTPNDGTDCTTDAQCNSGACDRGACRGSSCADDNDCRQGWTCQRRSTLLGGAVGMCVADCDHCPFGRTCQDGGSDCLEVPVSLTIAIAEPPLDGNLLLRVNEPVKFRAEVTTTGPAKSTRVDWRVTDVVRAPSDPARYEGAEIFHTFTAAGLHHVVVTASADGATAEFEASLDVK